MDLSRVCCGLVSVFDLVLCFKVPDVLMHVLFSLFLAMQAPMLYQFSRRKWNRQPTHTSFNSCSFVNVYFHLIVFFLTFECHCLNDCFSMCSCVFLSVFLAMMGKALFCPPMRKRNTRPTLTSLNSCVFSSYCLFLHIWMIVLAYAHICFSLFSQQGQRLKCVRQDIFHWAFLLYKLNGLFVKVTLWMIVL